MTPRNRRRTPNPGRPWRRSAWLRDPAHPLRLLPAYASGDHLHPNDAGMRAMAQAVPLRWFR